MRVARFVPLFFILLAVALTWPLLLHVGAGVEDLHDALLNTWILAWDGHQLLTDPLRLFDGNIFYPYGNTLAFSEIILPQALLALPFTSAGGSPILGYNAALLASFALSGFAMYLLVAHVTRSRWAGIAAGVIFAFNAYRMSNLAQAQLLALQWLPLVLLYLDRVLAPSVGASALAATREAGSRRRDALLLGLFTILQSLSSFYYAILTALAIILFAVVTLILRRRSLALASLVRALLALVLAALIVFPFVLPYLRAERDLGFNRTLAESVPFSASLAQYAQSLPGSALYGRLAEHSPVVIGGYALDALFPGLATLFLACAGLVAWRKRAKLWAFPLLLTVMSFLLSLGPTLLSSPQHAVDLPFAMPYRLLYLLPGMQALRAPVRFAALVFLGLSILAGIGVAAIGASKAGARTRAGAMALAVGIVIAEAVIIPAVTITPVAAGADVPPVYRWLAQQERGVILEMPMMAQEPERGLLNLYYSTYHWQATPDGYSGFIPPKHGEVVYEMQYFPSERSLSMLQGLDVRYLVVHIDALTDWATRADRLTSFAGEISEVQRFGATVVYRLAAAPRQGNARAGFYMPASAQVGQSYSASLIVVNQDARSMITMPTDRVRVLAVWQAADRATVRREETSIYLPVVVSEAGVATISLAAPPEGEYTLGLTASLPNGDDVRQSAMVRVQKGTAPQPQPIPARLLRGSAERDSYRPSETVRVSLRWRALGKIDAYYSVFVRLLDKNGEALVQADGQPANGTRPTMLWVPGEEIDDAWTLPIPATAKAGVYLLEAGLYKADDLSARLTLDASGQPVQRLLLGSLRIAEPLGVTSLPTLPINVALGDRATLLGYDIENCTWVERSCQIQRPATLAVTLYWRAEQSMTADYSVFVHLADSAGRPLAQDDSLPQQGRYPTPVWQRGDVIADRHVLAVSNDVPTGSYRLLAGLYDPVSGARLRTAETADAVQLVRIDVR